MSAQATNILLGVSGGIAAYKACHLVRNFSEAGHSVRVIPTPSALNFVGAATFEALSGKPVSTTVFDAVDEVQHVRVGQEAELIVIAPATADLMARLAAGRSDDLLSASVLVATCPVLIAPAMHTEMWLNPATQRNVEILRSYGYTVMEPAHGRLTGKDSGPGRLPDTEQIADLAMVLARGRRITCDWKGKKVLISAGGTREALDPVRFLGNHSSGRQGFALAEIAAQRGAEVTLVAGNTEALPTPIGAKVVSISTARELEAAMQEHALDKDLIIMAAAVADFRPASSAETKMKKGSESGAGLSTLEMVENPDILAGLVEARRKGEISERTTILGFAAETGDESSSALDFAKAKLQRKGCDFLMCNDVSGEAVFAQPDNRGWLLSAEGDIKEIEEGTKLEVAAQILEAVEDVI